MVTKRQREGVKRGRGRGKGKGGIRSRLGMGRDEEGKGREGIVTGRIGGGIGGKKVEGR